MREKDSKAREQVGREARRRHEALKAEVFKMEQGNYDRLILFRSTGSWWKMGGHSAILYYYKIARRIGRAARLQNDRDFYSRFTEGVVSVRRPEDLVEKLADIGVELVTNDKDLKIFKLEKSISKSDYEILAKSEQVKLDKINQIILPKLMRPDLHSNLLNLLRSAYFLQRKASNADRVFILDDFLVGVRKMYSCYFMMTKGQITEKEALAIINKMAEVALIQLKIMSEVQLWTSDQILRAANALIDVRQLSSD